MAAYSYAFGGSDGAGWETGWHTVSGSVAILTSKGFQQTAASAYAVAGSYFDGVSIDQNTNMTVEAVIQTVTSTEFYAAVNLRAGSTSFTDIKQHSSWHCLFVGTATQGYTVLYRISASGVATFLAGGADKDFVQGDTLRMRFSPQGNQFRCKYWRNATPEPAAWDIDYTDTSAPTGSMMSLMIRNGNNVTADRWDWDNLVIGAASTSATAGVATGSGLGQAASAAGRKNVDAPVATGVGTAHFEAAGGSSSVTIEAVDAVEVPGAALNATVGIGKSPTPAAGTGTGTAYNAGVNIGGVAGFPMTVSGNSVLVYATDPAVTSVNSLAFNFVTGQVEGLIAGQSESDSGAFTSAATGSGVANNASTKASGVATPTAATATATSTSATVLAVSANIPAGCATSQGVAGGVAYIVDENGAPILDEGSQPIEDGTGFTVHISPNPSSVAGAGAANGATIKVSTGVSAAVSVGSVPLPSIQVSGATNVNATTATGTGVANAATTTIGIGSEAATSTGAVTAAQSTIEFPADVAVAVGEAYAPSGIINAEAALAGAVGLDAQIDVLANNFAPTAAIPISVSAENPSVSIAVGAGLTVVGVAWPANQSTDIPGQLVTVHDTGHTVTVKER